MVAQEQEIKLGDILRAQYQIEGPKRQVGLGQYEVITPYSIFEVTGIVGNRYELTLRISGRVGDDTREREFYRVEASRSAEFSLTREQISKLGLVVQPRRNQ